MLVLFAFFHKTTTAANQPTQNVKKDIAEKKSDAGFEFQEVKRDRKLKPAASLVDGRVSEIEGRHVGGGFGWKRGLSKGAGGLPQGLSGGGRHLGGRRLRQGESRRKENGREEEVGAGHVAQENPRRDRTPCVTGPKGLAEAGGVFRIERASDPCRAVGDEVEGESGCDRAAKQRCDSGTGEFFSRSGKWRRRRVLS